MQSLVLLVSTTTRVSLVKYTYYVNSLLINLSVSHLLSGLII
jgi:hypothetical protein